MRIIAAIALVGTVSAAAQGDVVLPSLSRDEQGILMRVVLASEMMNDQLTHGYGDLAEVIRNVEPRSGLGGVQAAGLPPLKPIDASSASVADYVLRITRSDDRQRFDASLTLSRARDCADTGWFTDERFVIYTGHPICRH